MKFIADEMLGKLARWLRLEFPQNLLREIYK
jgi:uncharacterized protein with PIN domain